MALTSRLQTMGRVGGVAVTTAPYVRRVVRDEDLRADLADFVSSANDFLRHASADPGLRRDVGRLIESAQSGTDHLRADIRPRHYVRTVMIGTGLLTGTVIISAAIGIAIAWPRARQGVVRLAGQTTQRANATVHDIRERISTRKVDEQAA